MHPLWLPLALFVVMASLIAVAAMIFVAADEDARALELDLVHRQTSHNIGDHVEERLKSLEMLQHFLETRPAFAETDFSALASFIEESTAGFLAINFIDTDRTIRVVSPVEANRSVIGRIVGQTEDVRLLLEQARDARVPVATPPVALFQGGLGVATYLPLYFDGVFGGYVNGVFRLSDTWDGHSTLGARLSVRVRDGESEIWSQGEFALGAPSLTSSVPVFNRTWTVTVGSTPDALGATKGALGFAAVGTAIALLAAVFLSLSIRRRMDAIASEAKVALWADAFTNATQPMAIGDSKTMRIVACNPAYSRMFGKSREDIVGTPVVDQYAPAEYAKFREAAATIARTGATATFDTKMLRNGAPFPAEVSVASIGPADGSSLYRVASVTDLTERRAAEIAIREVNRQLDLIMSHTVDGLLTIDELGNIQTFSKSAERIFGYRENEVVGRSVAALISEADRATYAGLNWAGIAKIALGREISGRRKDGTAFPMDLAVSEMASESGGPRYVATVRDVTQRREIEEQLRQAQKMESVGQLTGGIAHDFNNLLMVIMGNLSLLARRGSADPDLQRPVEAAQRAAQRGADLTRRLLAFSRRMPLQPDVIDVNHTVLDAAGLYRHTLGEAIQIATRLDAMPGNIFADQGQLQNVLLNLVVNARDAMPNGGQLVVRTARIDNGATIATVPGTEMPPGPCVCLSVTDSGTGISQDVLSRIFEPFFTTKAVGHGSGLGLCMVFGFVKQSGGAVAVRSELDVGTTVSLYFPAVVSDEATASVEETAATQDIPSGRRVLVVEDDGDVRDVVVSQLVALGFRVHGVENGPAAITLLQSTMPFDFMVTDVIMPGGISGLELARQAHLLRPGLGILSMSGHTDAQSSSAAFNAEGIELLSKPFTERELSEAMARVIRR